MPHGTPTMGTIHEDSGVTLMARLVKEDATPVLQADLLGVSYRVFDLVAPTAPVAAGALTIADAVFDVLQTDRRWFRDIRGYNFRFTLGPAAFPQGGKVYRVEVLFVPVAPAAPFFAIWELTTTEIYSS